MALTIPTFGPNDTALFVEGDRENRSAPQPRHHFETLPGTNGVYVQNNGYGGRDFILTGILEGESQAANDDALDNFRLQWFEPLQAFVQDGTVDSYTDSAANEHTNCMMLSYEKMGLVQVRTNAAGEFICFARCRCVIRQLAPSL